MAKPNFDVQPGDVFQINEKDGRPGWIGSFVLTTEVRSWGIVGFVHSLKTHQECGRAYIRLPWENIEYVGRAILVPGDEAESVAPGHNP